MKPKTLLQLLTLVLFLGLFWHCSEDEVETDEPLEVNITTTIKSNITDLELPTPGNVRIEAGDGRLVVSWDEVFRAFRYELQHTKVGNERGAFTRITNQGGNDITGTRLTIDGLTNGQGYWVQVQSVGLNDKRSKWSELSRGTPIELGVPASFSVVGADSELHLSWEAATDALRYEIEYKRTNETAYLLATSDANREPITGTSFVLGNLENGVDYHVRIRVVDSEERKGLWSPNLERRPMVLGVPTNVVAAIGDGLIRVSWDEAFGASRYELRRKESALPDEAYLEITQVGGAGHGDITATNFTVVGLRNGKGYSLQVRSVGYNDQQESAWSDVVTGTPAPLGPPLSVEGEGANESIIVTWEAGANAARYELRYKWLSESWHEIRTNQGGSDISGTTFTITDLTNDTHYSVRVRSVNAAGQESEWVAPPAYGLPYSIDAPTSVLAVSLNRALQVSWEAVSGALGYYVRHKESIDSDDEYTLITNGYQGISRTHFTITGLTNSTLYTVQVQALNNRRQVGDWSLGARQSPESTIQPPVLSLVDDTGDDARDSITSDATIRLVAQEDSTVTISVRLNGTDQAIPSPADEFDIGASGRTNVDLESLLSAIVPTGTNTNVIRVTATAAYDHDNNDMTADQVSLSSPNFEFTLVAEIDDPNTIATITFALEDDTGTAMDLVTTNANVVVSGTVPNGYTLGFVVSTNQEEDINVSTVTGVGTHDFGLSSPTEAIDVVVSVAFRLHAHTFHADYEIAYTLLPLDFDLDYEDDGRSGSDGLTSQSILTVDGLDGFDGTNIKVTSYVITNTSSATASTNGLAAASQPRLSEDYEIDFRRLRAHLGEDEKIFSLSFNYAGHAVTKRLTPPLQYDAEIIFERQFRVEADPYGIAVTSNDVVLVSSHFSDSVRFYDTNGNRTNMRVAYASPAESVRFFGSYGNNNRQFNNIHDIKVDSNGHIYVADSANGRVQVYNGDFSFRATLSNPGTTALAIHDGYLYARESSGRLRTYELTSGYPRGMDLTGRRADGIAVDADGVIHKANYEDDRIEAFGGDPESGFTERMHRFSTRPGGGDDSSSYPWGIEVGPKTGRLYVSDSLRHQVLVLSYDDGASSDQYVLLDVLGNPTPGTPGSGAGEFDKPRYMAIHKGKLYVVDQGNHRVQAFDVPE